MLKLTTCLVAALMLTTSVSLAAAAPGLLRKSATMRAGPGAGFPVVERIPAGTRVTIHGCIQGGAWCDVSVDGERGWVAAKALSYLYREQYVSLPEYVEYVPVAPFVLTTYWSSFYFGRPWFHRHAFWNRYWRHHPPAMAHNPPQPGTNIGGAGRGPAGMGHPVAGTPTGTGGQPMPTPRMATGSPAPHPTGPSGPRMPGGNAQSAMPVGIVQPSMGRISGPPQSARAQMGGMRAISGGGALAGAAPHFGNSGISGPRMGASVGRGGGRSGPGGGFRRH
ncbi:MULTISPECIES: SH3 domain-containing protein [unclassified Bradyrhizobium]|uniref:SH3 domain-containing protein n=1 Tax=unclassified Bradyrhizobium TaxID=2631580 RepID=UPI0028E9A510|nr:MULTISPECIES: SH3 domain-containing protein [unclassified Bradyrhizobium]